LVPSVLETRALKMMVLVIRNRLVRLCVGMFTLPVPAEFKQQDTIPAIIESLLGVGLDARHPVTDFSALKDRSITWRSLSPRQKAARAAIEWDGMAMPCEFVAFRTEVA
jgi:hypothetical protein